MIKILFVCHGNICRSPMAKYILIDMVRSRGIDLDVEVESAATSREEIGNSIYPPAARELRKHGIGGFSGHRAHQMTMEEYRYYDMIFVMDSNNLGNARRLTGGDPEGKLEMLLDRDVADPWYTDDFETAYKDILEGCENLILRLLHG